MGAWGPGSFDNDDACDWVGELESVDDYSVILDALEAVTDESADYLEAPDCSMAVAAAEIVAALLGDPPGRMPSTAASWVEGRARPSEEIIEAARRAITLIKESSELRDLWEDSDDGTSWSDAIEDLEARLG